MTLYKLVCHAAHHHEAPTGRHGNECYDINIMTVVEYRRLMNIANDASSDGADPTTILDVILHEMDITIEDSAYQSIIDRMGGENPAFTFHTDQQRRLA